MKHKRKSNQKIWLIPVTIIVIFIVIIGSLILSKHNHQKKLDMQLEDEIAVRSPNRFVANKEQLANDFFSEQSVYLTYKWIAGYIVPESAIYGYANVFNHDLSDSENHPIQEKNTYFSFATGQKQLVFYDTKQKGTNDLAASKTDKEHVGELALSFNRPYTVAEIKKMLPKNMQPAWYWVANAVDDKIDCYNQNEVFGFPAVTMEKREAAKEEVEADNYKKFLETLKNLQNKDKIAEKVYQKYQSQNITQIKVKGVVVTGLVKNFYPLRTNKNIKAAVIGTKVNLRSDIIPQYK